MKIATINFSGNVGKSTLARHLLTPRLPGARIISVESLNSDGQEDEALRGRAFADLMDAVALSNSIVIDIGASNVEELMTRMEQAVGSHELIDCFLVPAVSHKKQQRDTISTVEALAQLGVGPDRIKVALNNVTFGDDPRAAFSGLLDYAEDRKTCEVCTTAVLHENEAFGRLAVLGLSIADVLADRTDHGAAIRAAATPTDKLEATRAMTLRGQCLSAQAELDRLFTALFSARR